MKVLVTGGGGFIGSNLVDSLIKFGYETLVFDNFLTGEMSNLKPHPLLEVCVGSIEDAVLVDKIFNKFKPNYVVHAAVAFHDPFNFKRDVDTNILGTINIIESSKKNGVDKIIYYQTSLCYGIYGSDTPLLPNAPYLAGTYKAGSSYAITKIAAELYLEMSGLNFIAFRLANVYGPRNFSGPLPSFYSNIINNKTSKIINTKRDFIFIDDVVTCTVNAITSDVKSGYFNISTENQTSIFDIYKLLCKKMGIDFTTNKNYILSEMGEDDTSTIFIDAVSTRKIFQWEPLVNLDEGIDKTLNWYRNNGVSKTFTHLKNINN